MRIIDKLIGVMAPFECLVCGLEGAMLCSSCSGYMRAVPSRCFYCHKATKNYQTCVKCSKSSPLKRVYVVAIYEGVSKEMIRRLKYKNARLVSAEIALFMKEILPSSFNGLVVPVPTTSARARRRGYDQAKLIARHLPAHKDCLKRSGKKHQVGANRTQRRTQLKGVFRVKAGVDLRGLNVLLVDDVLTTGSTLEEAARTLKAAGCKEVGAVVFAQAG